MEYIQCSHCDKRYAVSDKARAAVGRFTKCRNCQEDFLVVILNVNSDMANQDMTMMSGQWDPAKTMQPKPSQNIIDLADVVDAGESSEDEAHASAVLENLRYEKKVKNIKLGVLLVLVLVGGAGIYVGLQDEQVDVATAPVQPAAVALTLEQMDAKSVECRIAASQKWVTDYSVMHLDFTPDTYISLIKRSQRQTEKINAACKTPALLAKLIDSVMAKEKPDWIAVDIDRLMQ